MVDVIILLIVLLLIIFAVKGSLKHFRGEGPCCGGASCPVKKEKKLEGTVLGKKDVEIRGMSCENCALRVENALNEIDGLSANVSFNDKKAHIVFTHLVSDQQIRDAIRKAGYEAGDIN